MYASFRDLSVLMERTGMSMTDLKVKTIYSLSCTWLDLKEKGQILRLLGSVASLVRRNWEVNWRPANRITGQIKFCSSVPGLWKKSPTNPDWLPMKLLSCRYCSQPSTTLFEQGQIQVWARDVFESETRRKTVPNRISKSYFLLLCQHVILLKWRKIWWQRFLV